MEIPIDESMDKAAFQIDHNSFNYSLFFVRTKQLVYLKGAVQTSVRASPPPPRHLRQESYLQSLLSFVGGRLVSILQLRLLRSLLVPLQP